MGLIDTIASRLGYVPATKAGGIDAPAFLREDAEMSRFSIPDPSVYYNQADLFRRLSWVQGAVLTHAQTAAVTPFSVQRRVGEELRDIPNHDFELLLSRPNPLDSRFELLESTFAFRRLTGNSYWWLNRESSDAPPDEIWPIEPWKIAPVPDGKSYLQGYAFYPEGMLGSTWQQAPVWPLRTWEVVHFRGFNPLSRFVGLSRSEAIATVAQGDLSSQLYNTNFFGKENAKIPGALAFKEMVNGTDWKTIKQDIRDQFAGTKRSGPMLLRGVGEGGVSWVQMGLTQEEMQFLESRRFTKEEIYALFAPGLANVLDVGSSMANATVGKAAFVEFSVYPEHVAVGEKVTNDILPSYDRRGRSLVGAFDDIRVVDKQLRLQEIREYAKYHTTAEVRRKYYDGGDLPKAASQVIDGEVVGRDGRALPDPNFANTPRQLPAKAAQLLPDEQALLAALRALPLSVDASSLHQALVAPVLQAMAGAVAGHSGGFPLVEWAESYLALAIPPLLAALQGGPGPGDDWGWLIRMVVSLLTRARTWVMERLQEWFGVMGQDYELVWAALIDACPVCRDLDGTPKRLLPVETRPGSIHPFCRCGWRLELVPALQGAPA